MRDLINIVENAQTKLTFGVMNGPQTIDFIEEHDPDLWDNKRIRYLVFSEAKHETHITAFMGEKIVGMAGLQVNPYNNQELWIKFVSVDPDYQGQGIARQLLGKVYEYAHEKHKNLKSSSFTDDGERLRHIHSELQKQYPDVGYSSSN